MRGVGRFLGAKPVYLSAPWRILVGMDSGEGWRLGHRPALDGLRGIAVVLVVISHLTARSGVVHSIGPVGVTMFFTLSGFLITALLLGETTATDRVDLRRFYWHRVLRLAPALVATVTVVVLLGVFFGSSYTGWPLVFGALTYSANFVAMSGGGSGSALGHAWSLAIEEQFYLLWPVTLILLSRFGRRAILGFAVTGALVSASLRFAFWDDGWRRVYYGFDTRADALLVGCALAAFMIGRRPVVSHPVVAAAAVAGAVATAFGGLVFVFTLMPLVVAVATAAGIYAIVQTGDVRWLSARPLVWLGRRSYGLYLWHYPVVVAVAAELSGAGWLLRAALIVPVSLALTALSWRYVETPFLRLKDRPFGSVVGWGGPRRRQRVHGRVVEVGDLAR